MAERARKTLEESISFISAEIRPSVDKDVELYTSHLTNPKITKWNENRISSPFDADAVEWQYNNWYPTEDDVLIACFPKTGTTWIRHIVKHIFYKDGEEITKLVDSITPAQSYLEMGTPTTFEIMEKLPLKHRIYATHLPSALVNMERLKQRGCKIICIIRNPKDQLTSWYNMTLDLPFYEEGSLAQYFPADWNAFFDMFVSGKQPMSNKEGEWYPDHILSWLSYRDDDNVLFVMYEDLKKDICKELRNIAKFLGVNRDEEEITEIAKKVSFEIMKKQANPFHDVFRKGEVGDWKNQFTVTQSEVMDEKIAEKLSHTDIQFVYDL